MSPRIERIQKAVEALHNCRASHSASAPVHETFQGQSVWEGVVEVFTLSGHAKAQRCYAWEVPSTPPDYVAVLELPPVVSAVTAVRASIVAQSKTRRA